jgi:hypothetical protein
MTGLVLDFSASRDFPTFASILELEGYLKAQTYCPRPEGLAPSIVALFLT